MLRGGDNGFLMACSFGWACVNGETGFHFKRLGYSKFLNSLLVSVTDAVHVKSCQFYVCSHLITVTVSYRGLHRSKMMDV